MAATIVLTSAAGTNAPYKLGSPPDFGTLYSGRALDFDGVVDYVNIGRPVLGSSFTYTTWIKPDSVSGIGHIIGDYYGGGDETYLRQSSEAVQFQLYTSSETGLASSNVLKAGSWHHVVAVYDSGATHKIYVDGVEVGSGTAPTGDISQAADSTIGARRAGVGEYFNGSISNLQIWDKAWSLSDVQYAYTHPEKLITDNSSVTSGTTISNLKAWYPCTEGNPRSPQTTVYDGSEKGLGSEMIPNGDFDTSANWIFDDDYTYNATTKKAEYGDTMSGKLIMTDGEMLSSIVSGKVYRLSFTVSDGTMITSWYNTGISNVYIASATYTAGTHVLYFTAPASGGGLLPYTSTSGTTFSIDDISLKEARMGNHGTTTFTKQMISSTANNREFTNGTTTNWVEFYGSPTGAVAVNDTDNTLECTIHGSSTRGGAKLDLSTYATDTIKVGRTYTLKVDAKCDDASNTFRITANGTEEQDQTITTSMATYTYTFTATATGTLIQLFMTAVDAGSVLTLTNVSLEEVGVATGWTTADAEPLIPQTALMGMSKPMVFDGVDSYVTVPDDSTLDALSGTSDYTISAWVQANVDIATTHTILTKYDNSHEGFILDITGTNQLRWTTGDGSAIDETKSGTDTYSTSIGTWNHVAVTGGGGGVAKLYINGTEQDLTASGGASATHNTIVVNNEPLTIGIYRGGSTNTYPWSGIINEVSIFTSELSLAQVQELFNDGVPFDLEGSSLTGSSTLVSYWRNTGLSTWTDLHSTNTNNGTPTNASDTILLPEGTTLGKDILGFPLTHTNNGWLNLAGSPEYVLVQDNDTLDFGTGDFTVEFWIKVDDIVGVQYILDKRDGEPNWRIYTDVSNVNLLVDDNVSSYVAVGSSISANTWFHYAFVNDAGTLRAYKDSVAGNTSDITGLVTLTNAHNLYIGTNKDLSSSSVRGQLDEVRIYTKALSAAEITKNYKHGKGKHS